LNWPFQNLGLHRSHAVELEHRRKAMTVITVNRELQDALADLKEKTEVRDTSGNLLGYFTPRELEEERLYQYADRVIDPEEIRRRSAAQAKGFTIEQVMAHLKSLEKP
jgi:hypothetical protein